MLILTRRISESVIIGDHVKSTVLGVKGNQVRLGIDAAKEISVQGDAIYDRIQTEKTTEGDLELELDVAPEADAVLEDDADGNV